MDMIVNGYRVDPENGIVYGRRGLPFTATSKGYVKISHGRCKFYRDVHRFIWECMHGAIPKGMQINHINGIKTDNRIANLELVTPSENTRHAYRIGLCRADGEHNGRSIGKARKVKP